MTEVPQDVWDLVAAYADTAAALRFRGAARPTNAAVERRFVPHGGPGLPGLLPRPKKPRFRWAANTTLPRTTRGPGLLAVLHAADASGAARVAIEAAVTGEAGVLAAIGSAPALLPVVDTIRNDPELCALMVHGAAAAGSADCVRLLGQPPWDLAPTVASVAGAAPAAQRACVQVAGGESVLLALMEPPWSQRVDWRRVAANGAHPSVLAALLREPFGLGEARALASAVCTNPAPFLAHTGGLPPGCATGEALAQAGVLRCVVKRREAPLAQAEWLLGPPWGVPARAGADPALFQWPVTEPNADALLRPPWSLCPADLRPVLRGMLGMAARHRRPDMVERTGRRYAEAGVTSVPRGDVRHSLMLAVGRTRAEPGATGAGVLRALLLPPFCATTADARGTTALGRAVTGGDAAAVAVLTAPVEVGGYGLGRRDLRGRSLRDAVVMAAENERGDEEKALALKLIRTVTEAPGARRKRQSATTRALVAAVDEAAVGTVVELLHPAWRARPASAPDDAWIGLLLSGDARVPEVRALLRRLPPGAVSPAVSRRVGRGVV